MSTELARDILEVDRHSQLISARIAATQARLEECMADSYILDRALGRLLNEYGKRLPGFPAERDEQLSLIEEAVG